MVYNFNPGPSALPQEVLEELREEMLDFASTGYSLLEASHRSKVYEEVHNRSLAAFRDYLRLPPSMKILLLAGGASLQFAMLPMNLAAHKAAGMVISGAWSKRAAADAQKLGRAAVLWDGAASHFTTLPEEISGYEDCAYVYIASNETVHGVQWRSPPSLAVPLVADMSSDLGVYPVDWERVSLAYAGTQKNLGVAGLTVVIIHEALLEQSAKGLPAYLSYRSHHEKNSLYNTPPVYAIRASELVLASALRGGGIDAMEKRNRKKAELVYRSLEEMRDFYRVSVNPAARSRVSVVCTLADKSLEEPFFRAADKEGFLGIRGHRSVGGIRISLYNAVPLRAVEALCAFMRDFAARRA